MSDKQNIDTPGLEIQGFKIHDSILYEDLNGVISGEINVIPKYYLNPNQPNLFMTDFKTKIKLREGIDKYFNTKNYIGSSRIQITEYYPYKIFAITVSYTPLSGGGNLGKSILNDNYSDKSLFNRLPEELYLKILSNMPVNKIELLCTDIGVICAPSIWKEITLIGYGLRDHLRRIRLNKDPEIRYLKFDWKSMLELLDSYNIHMRFGNTLIEKTLNIASQTKNMYVLRLLIYGDPLYNKNEPNDYTKIGYDLLTKILGNENLLSENLPSEDLNLAKLLLKYQGIDVVGSSANKYGRHMPHINNPFQAIILKRFENNIDEENVRNVMLLMLRALKNQVDDFETAFHLIKNRYKYTYLYYISLRLLNILEEIYKKVINE